MRMVLCEDIRLGALCTENLGAELSKKWREARIEKYKVLIGHSIEEKAQYIALFGNLFGRERVAEAVLDELFHAVNQAEDLHVLLFLGQGEYNRVNYRSDKPKNLHLICMEIDGTFVDEMISIQILGGTVDLRLDNNTALMIGKGTEGRYGLSGLEEYHIIPSFEPTGFEDSLNKTFGYAVLEWESDGIIDYIETEEQVYFYHSEEIELRPDDDEYRISNMMELIGRDYGKSTILRVTLSGNTMFGMLINARKLKEILQKHVFYADVFDNTNMDIDRFSFENDISLASEFVRLTMQDDSLSETERNRMICFGWNALNGNEVSAE